MEKLAFKFHQFVFIVLEFAGVSQVLCLGSTDVKRYCSEAGDCYISLTEDTKTWNDAQKACKNSSSTLPIVLNPSRRQSFTDALRNLTSNNNSYWIGAKASYGNGATWRWLDGSRYDGASAISNGGAWSYYQSYAYVSRPSFPPFSLAVSPANVTFSYICQIPSSGSIDCQSAAGHVSYTNGNGCYVVYSQPLPWFSARNNCLEQGGDLASFGNLSLLNTSDRNILSTIGAVNVWIGLRSSWWNWIDVVTNSCQEVTFSNWNSNQPNITSPQCISTDTPKDGVPSWRDWNCMDQLPFICQVNFSADTSLVDTTCSEPTGIPTESEVSHKPTTTWNQPSIIPLAVGIGVGVGVPLIIALIVLIAVLAIRRKRKRESNNTSRSMKAFVKDNEVVVSSAEGNRSKPANQRPEGDYAEVNPHADAYDNANEPQSNRTNPKGQGIVYSDLAFNQSYP